jgi:hypothetical protein
MFVRPTSNIVTSHNPILLSPAALHRLKEHDFSNAPLSKRQALLIIHHWETSYGRSFSYTDSNKIISYLMKYRYENTLPPLRSIGLQRKT